MLLHRGELAQVAPEPPLERSGRRAGAKRPDVLMQDIGRPAILLMSPGQARQTIRTHHSVVHRPREGHMLATGQHVEAAEHLLSAESFTVRLCI